MRFHLPPLAWISSVSGMAIRLRRFSVSLVLAWMGLAPSASEADTDPLLLPELRNKTEIKRKPVTFDIGAFKFSPLLEVSEAYNDNIFANNLLRKGSFVTQIHAGGELSLQRRLNRYSLTYALQSTQFQSSPTDDYVDNYVGFNSFTVFDSRKRLEFNLNYLDSHYFRGYFFDRGLLSVPMKPQPDTYNRYEAVANFRYGGENARGNLELKTSYDDYTFTDNFFSTDYQDRTAYNITPGFYVKVAPKTRLLAQVENTLNTYKNEPWYKYEYLKERYLAGVNFDYTDYLRGLVRGGYLQQSFFSKDIKSLTGFTWDVNVLWFPVSYSRLEVGASRDIRPLIGNAFAGVSERYHIGWLHDWSPRLNTKLFAGTENVTYQNLIVGGSPFSRVDNYDIYGVDINYSARKWLGFSLSYTRRDLTSTTNVLNFNQDVLMFYVTLNPRIADDIKAPWSTWY